MWRTIDAAEGAQNLLVELVRDGLARLSAFVLVDTRDNRVRVLVRGEITARVHGAENAVAWSGSGVTTWVEKVFDRVDDVLIGDEEPSVDWLPLRAGIIRCGGFELRGADMDRPEGRPPAGRLSVDSPSVARSAGFAPSEPVAPSVPITAAAPPDAEGPAAPSDPPLATPPALPTPAPASPASVSPASASPAPPPEALAKPATLQVSVVESDTEPAPNPPPVIQPPDPAQTRTESPDDGFDHLFESTILRSVEDAAIRNVPDEASTGSMRLGGDWPGAAGPAGTPGAAEPETRLGDHDGYTITAAQLGALRRQPLSPDPIEPSPPPGARLELSTGDVVPLDRDVVIGRRPEVDRVQGGRVPTVVTVPSPRQDVSRTHLRIGWSGAKVLATDLHSMNGTVLIGTAGTSRTLDGGVPQQLAEGDLLDIGDGVTLTLRLGPGSVAP